MDKAPFTIPADARVGMQQKPGPHAYLSVCLSVQHSVVRIVREKLLQTSTFSDQAQLQAFLSQLYTFLVDQIHVSLNQVGPADRERQHLSLWVAGGQQRRAPDAPPPSHRVCSFQTLQVNVPNGEARALKDCSQLRHFAKEAEINADYDLASMYYQERIALDRSDPSHWFDYGTFCLLISDVTKAEECFQHALAIDQKHVPSLLLCGVMAEMAGRFEDAHTFFENATCVDATGALAWTMLGTVKGRRVVADRWVHFMPPLGHMPIVDSLASIRQLMMHAIQEMAEKTRSQERRQCPLDWRCQPRQQTSRPVVRIRKHLCHLRELMMGHGFKAVIDGTHRDALLALFPFTEPHQKADAVPTEDTQVSEEMNAVAAAAGDQNCEGRGTTIFMEAAHFLLQVNALQFAQRALAHELLFPDGGPSCLYHVTLARLQLHIREFAKAENSLQEALRASHENPDAWALNGHLQYLNGRFSDARQCYERTLDLVADTSELHAVYLRLGSIYLMEKQYHQAKQTYLRACKRSPTCLTWLGLGISCYRLQELSEAEDALSEANILNNRNPEVWGYLSLVCLQTNRRVEAEQAFKFAIKVGRGRHVPFFMPESTGAALVEAS
ncbi:CFA70 protein, partial [Polypterus senegalus]